MKYLLPIQCFFLLFTLTLTSCNQDSNKNLDCTNSGQEGMKALKADFDKDLAAYYKLDRPVSKDDYHNLILSTSTVAVDMSFYQAMDKIEKCARIKSSPVHTQIWDKNSSVKERHYERKEAERKKAGEPSQEFKHEMRNGDYYILNPHSDFYNCLINNTKSAKFKDFLISTQTMQEVLPIHSARSVLEADAFDDEAVQTYIALQFYYDYIFKLNRIHKVN